MPQIPNVGLWVSRGQTAERGRDSPETPAHAIFEPGTNRLMVFITHNTDFGDAYERESENPQYFQRFSVPGYAFGINVIIYSMTH